MQEKGLEEVRILLNIFSAAVRRMPPERWWHVPLREPARFFLEVQALVTQTNFGMPRRTAAGTDYNRVNLLMAVLEKRCRYEMSRLRCICEYLQAD